MRRFIALAVIASGLFVVAPTASADEIVVNTTKDIVADDGKCSLREAVTVANGNAPFTDTKGECRVGPTGDYRITLADKTYTLTIAEPQHDDANLAGDLDILGRPDIVGVGGSTIRQDAPDRVLDVRPDGGVFLKRVTITGGEAPDGRPNVDERSGEDGGGIRNAGALLLDRVTMFDNEAGDGAVFSEGAFETGYGGNGGAISSDGSITMTNSTIRDNRAGDGAAGVNADSRFGGDGEVGGIGGAGGGVAALGDVTIFDSEITGNAAGAGGRGGNGSSGGVGGGLGGPGGDGGSGGGMSAADGVRVERTTVANNAAGSGGNGGSGGASSIASGGAGGDSGSGGRGGGISIGTGIDNGEIVQSTISGNVTGLAGSGGAGGAGSPQGATGAAGDDGSGAGFHIIDGSVSIKNTTISGNQAIGGHGGGIYTTADLSMNNVTVANNAAAYGGGLEHIDDNTVVHNSIIADNTASISDPDCVGGIDSNGKNLIEDGTGCQAEPFTDVTGVDPELGPLKNNGGPTQTHAITKSSPAYNAGEQADPGTIIGACLQRDQRNKLRKKCDIGAYELVQRR